MQKKALNKGEYIIAMMVAPYAIFVLLAIGLYGVMRRDFLGLFPVAYTAALSLVPYIITNVFSIFSEPGEWRRELSRKQYILIWCVTPLAVMALFDIAGVHICYTYLESIFSWAFGFMTFGGSVGIVLQFLFLEDDFFEQEGDKDVDTELA